MKPIVDDKTREIVFNVGEDSKSQFISTDDFTAICLNSDLPYMSLEKLSEFVSTPLDDVHAINMRLDALEELILKKDLLGAQGKFVSELGNIFPNFYNALDEYQTADPSKQNKLIVATDRLVHYIHNMPELNTIPSSLHIVSSSALLMHFSTEYTRLMEERDNIWSLIKYLKGVDAKISNLIDEKKAAYLSAHEGEKKSEEKINAMKFSVLPDELSDLLNPSLLAIYREDALELDRMMSEFSYYIILASISKAKKWVRPIIEEREMNCLWIKGGYWPLTPLEDSKTIVRNDTHLTKYKRAEILEGVNKGGKTIDMKKALYIAVLALSGCFVPAGYARVSVRDRIVCREKGTGDLLSGLQQDAKSAKDTDPVSGEHWLSAMDETFTSTEKKGGRALTYGVVKNAVDQQNSLLIISSHYPDLGTDLKGDDRVRFSNFSFNKTIVQPKSEFGEPSIEITFPYIKRDGVLKVFEYAIAVAETRGFDEEVLTYARKRLDYLKSR
ncbi:MAG: hypothetical protein ABIJ34_07775 [archaeon]